jgi:hypothetical protein
MVMLHDAMVGASIIKPWEGAVGETETYIGSDAVTTQVK